ncbi:MAG: hypothetical protein ACLFV7_11015 [Phycisphaerae bacterium]
MTLRRLVCLLLPVAFVMAVACPLFAQDADADQAKKLLEQGIAQYKAHEFQAAKRTLLAVDSEELSEADQKTLTQMLAQADTAAREQAAAMSAYRDAQKALDAKDYDKAKQLYAKAAQSEYLLDATRKDAKAQLAWLQKRTEMANGAADSGKVMITSPAKEDDDKATTATDDGKGDNKMFSAVAARKDQAKQLVAKGKEALKNDQAEKAADYFGRALKADPFNVEAKQLLERTRPQVGTGGDDLLSERQRKLRVLRGATITNYQNYIKKAKEKLAQALSDEGQRKDFASAVENARVAKQEIETAKRLFTEQEYRERIAKADDLIEHIETQQDKWARERARIQGAEIARANRERIIEAQREKSRTIASLTATSKALVEERKWEEAADTMEEILRLDPRNRYAREGLGWVKRYIILQRQKEARNAADYQTQLVLLDNMETEIPWYELLRYPRNWRELTEKRKRFSAGQMSESEKDRRTRQRLQQTISKVDFSGIPFENVLSFLRDLTGANIVPNWQVLSDEGIDRSTEVTVEKLVDVTGEVLLEVVLENVGGVARELDYVIEDGIVKISTKEALRSKVSTRVFDIRDLIIPVPDFEGPRVDLSNIGEDQDTDGGGGGGGGLFADDDDDDTEEGPSRQEMIDKIIQMIKEKAPLDTWADQGGPGAIHEFGGQLVVTQTPEVHSQIMELVNMLREAKQIQVSVEARFITVRSGFLNQIGVNLDFYFNIGSGLGAGGYSVDPFTQASVPQVGRNGWDMNKSRVSSITPIPVAQEQRFTTGLDTGIAPDIAGNSGATGLEIFGTFLDDVQVDFLVQATQAHESGRTLTAPRVTMFNGQQAYIAVGTSQAYVSDLDPVVEDNAVTFDPEISFVTTGSTLTVRPTVSADRRYVTMTLTPQITNLNGFTTPGGTDPNGNPVSFFGLQLPNVTVTTVETTVTVPDGGTLLLGGQKISAETEREKGAPMLSKVPILNRLFTNREKVRDENTVLIFVKPKIIITREAEEDEDLYQEVPQKP